MIRINKFLSLAFLFAWVAGEVPRLWWKETVLVRPMDVAAGLLFLAEIIGYKNYKNYKVVGLIIAAAILGPIAARALVYGWLIWRGKEIFGGVKKWIVPAMAAFVGLGFLQYIFFPDTRFLLSYGWDEHYWRLIGTVLDPNYFGVMAGMIGFWAIRTANLDGVFSIRSARDPRSLPRRFSVGIEDKVSPSFSSMISKTPSSVRLLLLVVLPFIGLVLTWSRASWLAFAAAAGWWGLSGKSGPPSLKATARRGRLGRLGVLGGLVMLGAVVWWVAPKPGGEGVNLMRTSSIEQRLVSWNQAIEVWKQHPWVGVGFKDYGSELPSSSWLVILETMGVVGAAGAAIGGIRVIREIGRDRFWMALAIMLGIHAIFNNTLFYPPVLGLMAMMRAMDAK